MSTHDLDLALQMSDQLWLLQKNALISGTPEDLVLENAFQPMFNNGSIEFDNKTGLFKVAYNHNTTIAVKGHGFKYTLLRRALMRKGIKPVKATSSDNTFIKINDDSNIHFEIWMDNEPILRTNKVADTIKLTQNIIPLVSHNEVKCMV